MVCTTIKKYFTLTKIKAQEKIAQNTKNLSNRQAQACRILSGRSKYNSDDSISY